MNARPLRWSLLLAALSLTACSSTQNMATQPAPAAPPTTPPTAAPPEGDDVGSLPRSQLKRSARTRAEVAPRPNAGPTPSERAKIRSNTGPWGLPEKKWPMGKTDYVYYGEFVLEHSAADKIPLWVAHHLKDETRLSYRPPASLWHSDDNLPATGRAELADYKGWKDVYDRGHMAPNGDFATKASKEATFVLSNAVPQDSQQNQQLWTNLEQMVRDWAGARGESYVITGPMFYDPEDDPETPGPNPDGVINYDVIGPHEVAVPTHLFKIVLAPRSRAKIGSSNPSDWEAIAFVFENRSYGTSDFPWTQGLRSVRWIENRTGLDFFPAMDAAAQNAIETATPAALWQLN